MICKSSKDEDRLEGWVFTSERVATARVQLIFKLYELTKKEFRPGSVCPPCFELVDRIDGLEFQAAEGRRALRNRMRRDRRGRTGQEDCILDSDGDDLYVDEDVTEEEEEAEGEEEEEEEEEVADPEFRASEGEDEEEEEVVVARATTSRKRRKNWRKHKVKREKPDYDEEAEEEQGREERIDMSSYLKVEHHIKNENVEQEEGKPAIVAESVENEEDGHGQERRQQVQSEDQHRQQSQRQKSRKENSSNLDFNVTITRTTRGQEQLVYDGYTYLKIYGGSGGRTQGGDDDVTRWKCTSYYAAKTGCRARLNTTMDGACVLVDSKTADHNHPPPSSRHLKVILFREQVKKIASNHPEMKPADILANARMLQTGDDDGGGSDGLGLKDESLVRLIQRIKCKNKQSRRDHDQGDPEEQEPEQQDLQQHGQVGQEVHVVRLPAQVQVQDQSRLQLSQNLSPPAFPCIPFNPVTSYVVQVNQNKVGSVPPMPTSSNTE